jgi:L-asparaginase
LIESKAPNTQSGANGTKLSKTDGIIVAGTGSGTLSQDLEKALLDAQKAGIWMARVSRCAFGAADPEKHPNIPALLNLSPVQARVAMILGLLAHHATD